MEHEDMYFVVSNKAISIDDTGTPVICDMNEDGTVNWDTEDLIDWMDLTPDQYQLYKACVDFLQIYAPHPMYVK